MGMLEAKPGRSRHLEYAHVDARQPNIPRSALLVPVVLPEMTVIGPVDCSCRSTKHPEVQITMNFVAPPVPGKGKAIKDYLSATL
jgi:hypothetical protein